MPVDFLTKVLYEGTDVIPAWEALKTYGPVVLTLAGLKYYFRGATNTWERDLHGKVFMITGGTSGVGATVAYELASKGAQVILLVRSTEDAWTVDFVEDMREKTDNFMIYAEQCDLASLWSIRQFATKWLDNQPPRRLDGVICCAADLTPRGKPRQVTQDGIETQLGTNYFGHFHLLTLLSPSLRVQPPDRDVRVVLASCSSHLLGDVNLADLAWEKDYPINQPWKVYGTSKLLLGLFAKEFQKQLVNYERKDKAPCNVRINLVNPGLMRTPSTRRFFSMGSILGLILYVLLWPVWFIFLKSTSGGSQPLLFAVMAPVLAKMDGGKMIQECKIATKLRKEYDDEELQQKVFEETERLIEKWEKQSAIERNKNKKTKTAKKKPTNIYEKPNTIEELDEKMESLRSQVGIPVSAKGEMPLFPDPNADMTTRSRKKANRKA
ncbi:NAD(P)-binding protein [Suhomyces tanzawaensis NRRL Y-17324]|uniref:NAD(P)-binding protein n=1 Tax=Suhomyces tanzawaensis NRRL Y-17324 TaxID=984487 RepID=A0A1E4SGZ2_9ASCO|nr:NAD(P)-binding protein [Suhomyces tanzawaensis NRRL Y-17324]ODV78774.1 NAD(P)-binding protein [Suhomyces tanzawaensis NRRL Y-17324]